MGGYWDISEFYCHCCQCVNPWLDINKKFSIGRVTLLYDITKFKEVCHMDSPPPSTWHVCPQWWMLRSTQFWAMKFLFTKSSRSFVTWRPSRNSLNNVMIFLEVNFCRNLDLLVDWLKPDLPCWL